MTTKNEQPSDVFAKLREPFPDALVSKLPRVWCKACREAKPKGHCNNHQKKKCKDCGNNMTEAHLHLDYVGHGAVTQRLLDADPTWSWEPLAVDEAGMPRTIRAQDGSPVGLWIKLTVGGVSRLGYGSCDAGKHDAIKELIGDALRNAAMRFGVALDLWIKESPASDDSGQQKRAPAPASKPEEAPPPAEEGSAEQNGGNVTQLQEGDPPADVVEGLQRDSMLFKKFAKIFALGKALGWTPDQTKEQAYARFEVESMKSLSVAKQNEFIKELEAELHGSPESVSA